MDKLTCLHCQEPIPNPRPNKIYCCRKCQAKQNDIIRRLRFQMKMGIKTSLQKKEERLAKMEAIPNFLPGDIVEFKCTIGEILVRLEKGDDLRSAWKRIKGMVPDAKPNLFYAFESERPISTPRYFILVDVNGKPKVFCPLLHQISRNITNEKEESKARCASAKSG